jgi:hypothetical protein
VNGLQCSVLDPLLTILGLGNLQAVTEGVLGYVNCAELHTEGFAQDLTSGLLDQNGGRDAGLLTKRCSDAEVDTPGGTYTIDDTPLLTGGDSPLVRGGDGDALRAAIEAGDAPVRGRIKNDAFRCPRLAALPVIDTNSVNDGSQYPIVDILYAWIDDGVSGLVWQDDDTLQAVRGHVIDPGYFPETVTDSPVVGEYLGDYLPKEAVLVRDLSDAP